MSTVTGYNLRLKNLLFRKLRYISKIKHRSLNSQITLLVEELVQSYEKVNGKITEEDLQESEKEEATE